MEPVDAFVWSMAIVGPGEGPSIVVGSEIKSFHRSIVGSFGPKADES